MIDHMGGSRAPSSDDSTTADGTAEGQSSINKDSMMEFMYCIPDLEVFIDKTIKKCLLEYDLDQHDTESVVDDMEKGFVSPREATPASNGDKHDFNDCKENIKIGNGKAAGQAASDQSSTSPQARSKHARPSNAMERSIHNMPKLVRPKDIVDNGQLHAYLSPLALTKESHYYDSSDVQSPMSESPVTPMDISERSDSSSPEMNEDCMKHQMYSKPKSRLQKRYFEASRPSPQDNLYNNNNNNNINNNNNNIDHDSYNVELAKLEIDENSPIISESKDDANANLVLNFSPSANGYIKGIQGGKTVHVLTSSELEQRLSASASYVVHPARAARCAQHGTTHAPMHATPESVHNSPPQQEMPSPTNRYRQLCNAEMIRHGITGVAELSNGHFVYLTDSRLGRANQALQNGRQSLHCTNSNGDHAVPCKSLRCVQHPKAHHPRCQDHHRQHRVPETIRPDNCTCQSDLNQRQSQQQQTRYRRQHSEKQQQHLVYSRGQPVTLSPQTLSAASRIAGIIAEELTREKSPSKDHVRHVSTTSSPRMQIDDGQDFSPMQPFSFHGNTSPVLFRPGVASPDRTSEALYPAHAVPFEAHSTAAILRSDEYQLMNMSPTTLVPGGDVCDDFCDEQPQDLSMKSKNKSENSSTIYNNNNSNNNNDNVIASTSVLSLETSRRGSLSEIETLQPRDTQIRVYYSNPGSPVESSKRRSGMHSLHSASRNVVRIPRPESQSAVMHVSHKWAREAHAHVMGDHDVTNSHLLTEKLRMAQVARCKTSRDKLMAKARGVFEDVAQRHQQD